MVKLENVDGITDILITKSVHKKAKYCVDDFEYSQYHCLVEEYKKGQSKLGMECVTPWTQSILDGKINKNIQSCNDTEFEREFKFIWNFFRMASNNNMTACYGNDIVDKVML